MLVPFILRTIRKARWYKIEGVSWLEEGDIPADPLADLATKNNELSVWLVDDHRLNLERVVVALAANRTSISNLDYVLFDLQLLSELNIKVKQAKGVTPDEDANSWHRDLVELSALKLVELTKAIFAEAEIKRIPEKKIGRLLAQAVVSGRIDQERLKQGIRNKID